MLLLVLLIIANVTCCLTTIIFIIFSFRHFMSQCTFIFVSCLDLIDLYLEHVLWVVSDLTFSVDDYQLSLIPVMCFNSNDFHKVSNHNDNYDLKFEQFCRSTWFGAGDELDLKILEVRWAEHAPSSKILPHKHGWKLHWFPHRFQWLFCLVPCHKSKTLFYLQDK